MVRDFCYRDYQVVNWVLCYASRWLSDSLSYCDEGMLSCIAESRTLGNISRIHRSLAGCGCRPYHPMEEVRHSLVGCILMRMFSWLIIWQHGHSRMNEVKVRSVMIVGSLRRSLHFSIPQRSTMELCTVAICLKIALGIRCFGSIVTKKASFPGTWHRWKSLSCR